MLFFTVKAYILTVNFCFFISSFTFPNLKFWVFYTVILGSTSKVMYKLCGSVVGIKFQVIIYKVSIYHVIIDDKCPHLILGLKDIMHIYLAIHFLPKFGIFLFPYHSL